MNKKQFLALGISASMLLTACSNTPAQTETESEGKLSIVATSFHEYDWVMEIVGENEENFDITWLMDTGVDLHSYEPSVEDVITISDADLFIYNGGPSQSWVPEVIEAATNENQVVINVIDFLGDAVKVEVAVEGMQASSHDHSHEEEEHTHEEEEHTHDEEEHSHDEEEHSHEEEHTHDEEEHTHDEEEHTHDEEEHTHDEEEHSHDEEEHTHDEEEHTHDEEEHSHDEEEHTHDEEEHTEHVPHDDEHVWLSLDNAVMICEVISEEIIKLDNENSAVYTENTENYTDKLKTLDEEYTQYLSDTVHETIIFADRFPFLYMMSEYDIDYYAAFQGCSAETEASVETVAFITQKLDENETNAIFIIDDGLEELAQTVIDDSTKQDSESLF